MNKKFKKLLRDPKSFFKDMYLNYSRKFATLRPRKYDGHYHYTVVSAVYNVGKYLDDYFNSLVKQRLDFRKHIHLVLVDDGSTDNSADIIRKWQKRFPANVTYLYKENGGQASARNLGLEHVRSEWVSFIDPDDFVDLRYFAEVDNFLFKHRQRDLRLFSCNFVFYFDNKQQFSDTHPLRYRFTQGDKVFSCIDLEKHVQLTVNSVFFLSASIRTNSIAFDSRVKPSFEDGVFVADYMACQSGGTAGFGPKAKYYYRKRDDGTSTLDSAWSKVGRYTDVLEFGYLRSMHTYLEKFGSIPEHFQRTVLYDLTWHVKTLVNHSEIASFLTEDERDRYFSLLDQIFALIDDRVIINFDLAGCWLFHKIGMLGCFKGRAPEFRVVYVEDFDPVKNQLLLRYFSHAPALEEYRLDGDDTLPLFAKTTRHDFLGRSFVCERRIWIPIGEVPQKLRVILDGVEARISLGGKQHRAGLVIKVVREFFNKKRTGQLDSRFAGAWLLLDRDTQADDNAEHFYRFLRSQYPKVSTFFVLRRESHDWVRLAEDGFNLLAYGSQEHEVALRSCGKIISSHADHYVVDYFKDKSLTDKHFVFLQHGVIGTDLSRWLNSKNIDCFVTSAVPEHRAIVADAGSYKFTRKEVVLCGLPRHDALLSSDAEKTKTIVIMPTWRQSLAGKRTGAGSETTFNPDFIDSEYARAWQHFLSSTSLQTLAITNGYEIIFFPHAYVQPYLHLFDIPNFIRVVSHRDQSIQFVISKATIMITDYSSVAFDMALMLKPVLYYQFDEETIFNGGHTALRGYFDYRRDGFGPVVNEEGALLEALEHLLVHGCRPDPEYLDRMQVFFPFRDGKNCERTYQAILALDAPHDPEAIDLDILFDYAERASLAQDWSLAESRWRQVLEKGRVEQQVSACLPLARALREQGKLTEAQAILTGEETSTVLQLRSNNSAWQLETAELCMSRYNWEEAEKLWATDTAVFYTILRRLTCLAELGRVSEASEVAATLFDLVTSPAEQSEIMGWLAVAESNWENVLTALSGDDDLLPSPPTWRLLRARAYREMELFGEANTELVAYEKNIRNNPACRIEIARLAFARQQWAKTLTQLAQAYPEGVIAMPLVDALMWVQAQRLAGKLEEALTTLVVLDSRFSRQTEVALESAELASARKVWHEAITLWENVISHVDYAPYRLAEAFRMTGDIEQGLEVLTDSALRPPQSVSEWSLRGELAHLSGDWSEATACWTALLRFHSDEAPSWVWERLQSAQMMDAITQIPTRHNHAIEPVLKVA